MLADLAIGDRIVRKADGGRRLEAIRGIPDKPVGHSGDEKRNRRMNHGIFAVAAWTWLAAAPIFAADGVAKTAPFQEAFTAANAAWAKKDFAAVRAQCGKVVSAAAPTHYRSYAHLRIAQSYLAEANAPAARAEYQSIAACAGYPDVHRHEAAECVRELDRTAKGVPARDPAATRTKVSPLPAPGRELFVAPDGSDANPGTAERPFATLAKARDSVRALLAKGPMAGGVAVTLKPGEYRITETLPLTAADSGKAGAPIVYRAQRKGDAVLYGGAHITGFEPVTDPDVLSRLPEEARGKVRQCNLKALGIADYGELKVRGFGQPPSPPTLEVYVDGAAMTPARWPNEGFVLPTKLVEPGSKKEGKPSVLGYKSDRHARWTAAPDVWLFGYFKYLWADATIRITRIDTAAKTLAMADPYNYGGGGMDARQGIIYYAFNLLEEIDRPGEWYLDRKAGVLYLWPPLDLEKAAVEIGMLSVPMIEAKDVSHVRFEGLVFDLSRDNAVVLEDAADCLVAGCTIRRMAGNGITIAGGKSNILLGCDIHTIGRRASEIIGGDRTTLTPGGHVVENCCIHNFGRIDRTYTPAVQLEGVGNRVAHNLFYDCPSSTMRIEGNDHVIEYNEVHNAVLESDDQGAMELFGNPTYRGVVFRHNLFHQIGATSRKGVHDSAGIRFDDAISGLLVYGNVFWRAAGGNFGGVQINSGRDNIIDNNFFIDCKQGVSGGWRSGHRLWKIIDQGNPPATFIANDLYHSRYPGLARGLPALTKGPAVNHIWRNVFYRCGRITTGSPEALDMVGNGVFADVDPGFLDAANGDLRLKPKASLFATVGFRPIPLEEIGLYKDEYRASWPARTGDGWSLPWMVQDSSGRPPTR